MKTDADANDIRDWQRRFFAGPKVYGVSALGEIVDYYESREAAEIAVAWRKSHGERAHIITINVHTLELSRERWT